MEPTEPPLVTRPGRRVRRFGLPSVRLRLGTEGFELSAWDWEPLLWLIMFVACWSYGLPMSWRLLWELMEQSLFVLLASCIAFGLLVGQARCVVTVTKTGAFAERRVFGICWRRRNLGVRPAFEWGGGWEEDALVVKPADEQLRKLLGEGEEFVLTLWGVSDEHAIRDGVRVIALANAEIARLHQDLPDQK